MFQPMPPPQSIPGDANLDGNTNVIDVVTIANHLLEIKKLLTGKALTNADQDGDDKLTVVVRERERKEPSCTNHHHHLDSWLLPAKGRFTTLSCPEMILPLYVLIHLCVCVFFI